MTWQPDMASVDMEKKMEDKDLPESDRDEVRRFSEFLRLRKVQTVITKEMHNWLIGEEATDDHS